MSPLFEYQCECGESFDKRLKEPTPKARCKCGKNAKKALTAHAKTASQWVV